MAISACSNIVDPLVPSNEQDVEPMDICFRMHSREHMLKLGDGQDDFAAYTLIMPYLGFVPQPDSDVLFELYHPKLEDAPDSRFGLIRFPIWKFDYRPMSYHVIPP